MTAYFLKTPATLYHFYVNINQTETTETKRIIIALIGPAFSLCAGALFWIFYEKSVSTTAKLFLLYAAILGINIFFGNLFSTAFAGDFSKVFRLLHFSQALRYSISAMGLLALIYFMLMAGKEFFQIGFSQVKQKEQTIINLLLIPWILGTGLLILAYTPLPSHFVTGMILGSVFWIFSIIGAVRGKPAAKGMHFSGMLLSPADVVLFLVSILVVRILVPGVHFSP